MNWKSVSDGCLLTAEWECVACSMICLAKMAALFSAMRSLRAAVHLLGRSAAGDTKRSLLVDRREWARLLF